MASTPLGNEDELRQKIASALGLPPVIEEPLDAEHRRRYGLTVGGQRLLLNLANPVHVVNVVPAYRLPNTRPWFLGLTNLRGALVPLYDLAGALDLPESPHDRRMLMVLGEGDEAAATLIDGPPRHVLVGENQTLDALPSLHPLVAPHALCAYRLGDGIWVELDWRALFDDLRERALGAAPGAAP